MFGCGVKEFTSNEYGDDDDDDEQPLCLALVTHNNRHKLMKKNHGKLPGVWRDNPPHVKSPTLATAADTVSHPRLCTPNKSETTRGFASRSCIRCINEL